MFINNEQVLRDHIRQALLPVYYLYGTNGYLVHEYAKALLKRASGGDSNEYSVMKFDFTSDSMEEAAAAALSVSFFGGTRCIYFPAFRCSELREEQMETLMNLIPLLTEGTCLVIQGLEPPSRKGNPSLAELVDKNGALVELAALNREDWVRFCQKVASRNGASIKTAAADYLLQNVTADMTAAENELSKLAAYCTGREITVEDIDLLCRLSITQNVFDLSRAINDRNTRRCFEIINRLRLLREEPVTILGALQTNFLDMYRVKLAAMHSVPLSKVAADFEYPSGGDNFRLRNASASVNRLNISYLRSAVSLLSDCDLSLKTAKTDGYQQLEQACVRLVELRGQVR